MKRYNTQGLRGSSFEEIINHTNEIYIKNNLALIQKISTPIKPISINKNNNTISLAYFEKKSTVDYIGVTQGIPICFDAKETKLKSLPIKNIHEHQIEYMNKFEQQKGIAFLLVHFLFNDTYFYLPFEDLKKFWIESRYGQKSIAYNKFKHQIFMSGNYMLDYLAAINKFIL